VVPVAPTSPTSCINICSTFQLQDEITQALYSSIWCVTQYGATFLLYFHITTIHTI
jgi:hypothetical protein